MEKSFGPRAFEWDVHNIRKNWEKHGVSLSEAEAVFFNEPILIAEVDESKILFREQRRLAYGVTNSRRRLFIVFMMRGDKIRVMMSR